MKVLYSESKNKNSPSTVTKKRNDTSTVIQIQNFLIPGDSPSQKEKIWAKNILPNNKIEILILGHHGSKTSSSEVLISRLSHLKMAIASSRSKKYGHPHKKVIERLKKHRLNVIRTEDWGTLMIQ
jgi:competence protein ComEC